MKRLSAIFGKKSKNGIEVKPEQAERKPNRKLMEGIVHYDYDESYAIPEIQLTNLVPIESELPKDLLTEVT